MRLLSSPRIATIGDRFRQACILKVLREGAPLGKVRAQVPTWLCGRCGRPFFDEREVGVAQSAIRTLDEQTRPIAADVA